MHTTPAPLIIVPTYQEVTEEDRHDHHKGDKEEVSHGRVNKICFIEDGLKVKLPGRLHDRLDESTRRREEGTQHSRSISSLREVGVEEIEEARRGKGGRGKGGRREERR